MWRMLWTTRSLIMISLGCIGYFGYQGWQGHDKADQPLRVEMAEQVARQASLALPIPEGRPLIAIAPVSGDFQSLVTGQLRTWIARRNATIADLAWWEPIIPERFRAGYELTPERSCQWAAQKRIPYVVHARVLDWTTDPYHQRELTIEMQLIATKLKTILYANKFRLDSNEDSADASAIALKLDHGQKTLATPTVDASGAPYRPADPVVQFLVWLISGLTLPWLGASVIARAVRSDSNVNGLLLVIGYLGFMGALAWYLWGNLRGGWLSWSFLLMLSSTWIGYLEFVCRMLDNQPERT
jgi:hypothetical protein